MPALKIHSNREYIDSYVIELSLSSLCHGKPRIALRTHVLSKARRVVLPSLSATHESCPSLETQPRWERRPPQWPASKNVTYKINVVFFFSPRS